MNPRQTRTRLLQEGSPVTTLDPRSLVERAKPQVQQIGTRRRCSNTLGWLTSPLATYQARHAIGFTLIELLVVVTIISMLLAILMPTMRNARDAARDVICMSNLKQMGTLAFTYGVDHNARVPINSATTNTAVGNTFRSDNPAWDGLQAQYLTTPRTDLIDTSGAYTRWPTKPKPATFKPLELYQCPMAGYVGAVGRDDFNSYRVSIGIGEGWHHTSISRSVAVDPDKIVTDTFGSVTASNGAASGPSQLLYVGDLTAGTDKVSQGRGAGAWAPYWRHDAEPVWTNGHLRTGRPFNRGQGNILLFDMHVEKEPGNWAYRDKMVYWQIPPVP